jgi:hypothetical protein
MPCHSHRSAARSGNRSVAFPDDARQPLKRILERFENAWRCGDEPALDDYLAEIDDERRALLIELVHEDLAYRLQAGQAARVESYLERYSELRSDPAVLLDLLAAEYLLRQARGAAVTFEEYRDRFPEQAADMPRQVALRQAAGKGLATVDSPAEAVTVPPAGPNPAAPAVATAATTDPASPCEHPAAQRVLVPGYEVLGLLGQGGMGIVYQARQTSLGRVVALKMVLHAGHAGDEERRRFRAEAEAIARLKHPNVVQVHEVGESGGVPFFAMEFCEGGSLDAQLDGTPWQPAKAAVLVQTLAGAMHAAHQAGVVHRDLKPANVLLTADGTPKVTDFGLAKRLDMPGPTRTGAVMGTPSYMAPEQAGGRKDVGPAADVWALGALLYELLTGRPPFKAATDLDTVLQVLGEEPVAVRRLQPKVPRDLETICHQCLQKDPNKRYPSAAALAEDLRRFGASEPVAARPVGAAGRAVRWARRRPAVAGLLALVAAVSAAGVGGILWYYAEALTQRNAAQAQAQRADEQAQRADGQAQRAEQKAADAQREKAMADGMLYVSQIGRADTARLAGNLSEAQQVLDSTRVDLRGWEYGYLQRRIEGTPPHPARTHQHSVLGGLRPRRHAPGQRLGGPDGQAVGRPQRRRGSHPARTHRPCDFGGLQPRRQSPGQRLARHHHQALGRPQRGRGSHPARTHRPCDFGGLQPRRQSPGQRLV